MPRTISSRKLPRTCTAPSCPPGGDAAAGDKSDADKKERRSFAYLLAGILSILLVAAAIVFLPKLLPSKEPADMFFDDSYEYNNYTFRLYEGLWFTEKKAGQNVYSIGLHFGPREAAGVPVTGDIDAWRDGFNDNNPNRTVYIIINASVSSKYETMAAAELATRFSQQFFWRPANGCIEPHPVCESQGVSVQSCEDALIPSVYIRLEEPAGVWITGRCAIVSGRDMDVVLSADRLLWGLYDIME